MSTEEKKTVSAEEFAERWLDTKPWRLYEMVKEGKAPPHFRVARTLRFRVAAIESSIEEQESAS